MRKPFNTPPQGRIGYRSPARRFRTPWMTFASRFGDPRSPRKAVFTLNGIYSATLEMILSTVIGAFRMLLRGGAGTFNEARLRDRALCDFVSCYLDQNASER